MSSLLKRSGAAWPALANAALGGWLFLSPFFLGFFEEMVSSLNAYIIASLIMVLACYAGQSRETGEDKLVALCALWLVASPWIIGYYALTDIGSWNAALTGTAVLACVAWSLVIKQTPATTAPIQVA